MDDPGAGHRLDHGRHWLLMDLLDPAGERLQRADIRRNDELVQVLSLSGEQADVELLST